MVDLKTSNKSAAWIIVVILIIIILGLLIWWFVRNYNVRVDVERENNLVPRVGTNRKFDNIRR